MKYFSKVCDAADWFQPEVNEVIRSELQEIPRFHRKQWEFAKIFLALKQHRMLKKNRLGLSMGSGKERLAYAIAKHVRRLMITDLYNTQTLWDCARTGDPDAYIKINKPFAVDDARLMALNMDMRELEFESNSLDFCYSSCSVEHIGGFHDFLKHLKEVYRVLKDGGLYVFTTEFHYGPETIEHPGNYVFSADYLNALFLESPLRPERCFHAGVTPHKINHPVSVNVSHLCYMNEEHISFPLLEEYPHVQLLLGKYPYTSAVFVLRKDRNRKRPERIDFCNLEDSRKFLESGMHAFRRWIEESTLTLAPYSFARDDSTLFHTDYFWFGSRTRRFLTKLRVKEGSENCRLELRAQRYPTLNPSEVECIWCMPVSLEQSGWFVQEFSTAVGEDYNYAVLARVLDGACSLENVEIISRPHREV